MAHWNEICRELNTLSEEAYRWAVAQPSVGEESLTDWFLYSVSERLPFVKYHKFTKREEARDSGADWDWWFVDSHNALGMRIQAKRLRSSKDLYPSLAYSNQYGLQIDRLRESASASNLLPLYAFYSSEPKPALILCDGGAIKPSGQGIFLAAAGRVCEKLFLGDRQRLASDEMIAVANPMPCIACCSLVHEGPPDNPVRGLQRHLSRYFPTEFAGPDPAQIGIHDGPPRHVVSLLRGDREEMGEAWEREFAPGVVGTKAILAFSLTD